MLFLVLQIVGTLSTKCIDPVSINQEISFRCVVLLFLAKYGIQVLCSVVRMNERMNHSETYRIDEQTQFIQPCLFMHV